MEFTKIEKRIIKHYKSWYIWLIGYLTFLVGFFVLQQWLLFSRFIPAYVDKLNKYPDAQYFVVRGMYKIAGFLYIWPAFFFGFLIGLIISIKLLSRLLDKLTKEQFK